MTTKTITYEEVEERLKNVPLEQYTSEDIFQRYIARYNRPICSLWNKRRL